MPDPDLTAYLDGEADAAATARIEARLASDHALRAAALTLLRQRVLIARVLPGLAATGPPATRRRPLRATPRKQRWWLFAVAGAAAAAGLAAVLALSGAPPDAPTAGPDPGPVAAGADDRQVLARLADGTTWSPRQHITCDRTLTATLADGARLELEVGTVLLVPATSEGPWQLERGALRCVLPGTQRLLLATAQAEVRAEGADLRLAADAEGSDLAVRTGTATASDLFTRSTHTLHAGSVLWLPADTTAPRMVAGAEGRVRGTVLDANARSLELATRFGSFRFTPRWLPARRMSDPEMGAQLDRLRDGKRVEVTWFWEEHLRVTGLRILPPAPAEAPRREGDF